MWHRQLIYKKNSGFTIVELLVVIVVIGILTAVSVVGYGSWRKSVDSAAVKSDLVAASNAMESYKNFNNGYPITIPTTVTASSSVTLTMYPGGTATSYCIDGASNGNSTIAFYIDSETSAKGAQAGTCASSRPPSTAPDGFVANAISTDAINLSWNTVAGATSYKIQRSLNVSFATIFDEGTQSGNSLSSTGLSSATSYFYRIQAVTAGGGGPWSTIVSAKTNAVHTAISAGYFHTCSIAYGKAYCWGTNDGRLGDNTTTNSNVPVAVNTSLMSGTVTAISASHRDNTCAIATGKAYCWGNNYYGQLGNNTFINSNTPVAVDTGSMSGTVTAISPGYHYACAIASGKAYCWGSSAYGGLGTENYFSGYSILAPVAVNTSLMSGTVTAISATGNNSTCAIASGKAYCWGNNDFTQLGNNTTNNSDVPVAVNTSLMSGTVTAISAGNYHTCAIASGQVYCWGGNGNGQLGDGTTTDSSVPVAVNTDLMSGAITAVSVGSSSTCAIASGQAYCWGYILGNDFYDGSSVPVAVNTSLMSGTVTAISAGNDYTCAIASAQAYCWGYNYYGQLGNNTTTSSIVPLLVGNLP